MEVDKAKSSVDNQSAMQNVEVDKAKSSADNQSAMQNVEIDKAKSSEVDIQSALWKRCWSNDVIMFCKYLEQKCRQMLKFWSLNKLIR